MKTKLYEFANLNSSRTGIKKIMIHAYCQGDKESPHGPRIKVSNVYEKFRNDDCFVINIINLQVEEGVVKIKLYELELVKKWIVLNKKILLKFWKSGEETSIDVFLDSIKKI
jgi:hypothetical protein